LLSITITSNWIHQTFGIDYYKMTAKLITRAWVFQAFPFLLEVSELITLPIAKKISGALYEFLLFRDVSISIPRRILGALANM
jgi:hypothetical protein